MGHIDYRHRQIPTLSPCTFPQLGWVGHTIDVHNHYGACYAVIDVKMSCTPGCDITPLKIMVVHHQAECHATTPSIKLLDMTI